MYELHLEPYRFYSGRCWPGFAYAKSSTQTYETDISAFCIGGELYPSQSIYSCKLLCGEPSAVPNAEYTRDGHQVGPQYIITSVAA